MIKLTDLLNELNVPKPEDAYPLTGPEVTQRERMLMHKYRFKNRKGDDMTIGVNLDEADKAMYVIFYETSEEESPNDDEKYGRKTGSGDMIKVLATVVEAVKRTADKVGGMDNVRKIIVQPSDQKRYNIYANYVQTLFPDFNVQKSGSWINMTNKNYKPEEVTEVLEPSTADQYDLLGPKVSTHEFSDGSVSNYYTWMYKNRKGQKMEITIAYEAQAGGEEPRMIISFGKTTSSFSGKYKAMTGAGDLKTILNSILTACQEVISREIPNGVDGLYAVGFEPSDERRERIYDYFITKEFPNFKVDRTARDSREGFTWYINQNYEA